MRAPRINEGATRRTFAQPALEEKFRLDGYVVVPLVEPAKLPELRQDFEPLVPTERGPFFGPYRESDSTEVRRAIDAAVRPMMAEAASGLFERCRLYLGALLVKQPTPEGFLGLHRDMAFVDERHACTGIVWLPLEPMDCSEAGQLLVVPGSHLLPGTVRGTPPGRPDIADVGEALFERSVVIEISPGQAVIYNSRLVHGSIENRTERPRYVASVGFVPEEISLHCFVTSPDGSTWVNEVPDEFLVDGFGAPPDWWRPDSEWAVDASIGFGRPAKWFGPMGRSVTEADVDRLDLWRQQLRDQHSFLDPV